MDGLVKSIAFGFIILFSGSVIAQSIVLNEIEYSNKSILYDIDGDTPDWFEIYNPGNDPVNLENYKVTTDTSEEISWAFPRYELAPHSFIVVFASGKNVKDAPEFHTDFKLGLMKEPLYLINPENDIVDEIKITCVPADYSLARKPDGTGNVVLTKPSPGYTNNGAQELNINFQPDSLSVNYQSGFYSKPITIKLKNKVPENKIIYTLDGNIPDAGSTVYESDFLLKDLTPNKNRFANIPRTEIEPGNNIFKANIVRAIVYSDGCPASNEICNTYFIGDQFKKYEVPVVSLITEKNNLFDDETGIYVSGNYDNYNQHGKSWERPVHIEIFDSSGHLIIDQNGGIRIHGRGSRGAPQKSLRLYARPEYGKEYFEYPFFVAKEGLFKFKTLLLRSTRDWSGTLFKDEMCHALVRNMNIDYTGYQTVITFINGEYWGIYSLRERQDKYYIENKYQISDANPDIIGYDPEIVSDDLGKILVEEGTIDVYKELINFLDTSNPESYAYYENISKKIDIDGLIDFFVAQLYLANLDFPNNNYELWNLNTDTSKWRYFFFDLDGAMIRTEFDHLSEYNNLMETYQRFPAYSMVIFRNLLNNPEFRNKFYGKFNYHLNKTFNISTVVSKIIDYEKVYTPLVTEHINRWHIPSDYIKWKHNVEMLKDFAIQRPIVITEQLQHNFGNPFFVFPNSSNSGFYLQFYSSCESVAIKIYNTYGNLIFEIPTTVIDKNQISIQYNFRPGLYLLEIAIANRQYTEKLIFW